MQITQTHFQDADYPADLREISSPPTSLYALGKLPKAPMVAVVGTRTLTAYGEAHTYQIALELARAGLVIVSGLALGVDAIAHRAALDAGGTTVAVLACGLDRIYPAQHRQLAKDILAAGGALVSEYPAGVPPLRHQFVLRNRIIAGLAVGTLVTESPEKGGALYTAHKAIEYGRVVMALPGDVGRPTSVGTNNLIRAGAIPITGSTDVLGALELPTGAIPPARLVSARNPHEAKIIELLQQGVNTNEQLIEGAQLTPAEFASIISLMEITGQVRNLSGGVWAPR